MVCDAPYFCCESGVQGDQECQGKCIGESLINNGRDDCSNGLDEKGNNWTVMTNQLQCLFLQNQS